MGVLDWFSRRRKPGSTAEPVDPLHDLSLSTLRVGYLVDYDLRTWEVAAHNRYDFGDGYGTEEWELRSSSETLFLEREEDDEVEWSVSRKIPIGAIDGDVRKHILEHDDPPSRIVFDGVLYHLDGSGAGRLQRGGAGEPEGFIYWDFIDRDDTRLVSIEQWGEMEFEAAAGQYVEEYEFSNILPRETEASA
jgi:hypothetical protein